MSSRSRQRIKWLMLENLYQQGLHWIIFQMADSKKDDDKLNQKEFDKVFEKIYDQFTWRNSQAVDFIRQFLEQ